MRIARLRRLHRLVLDLHGADRLHEVCSMAQEMERVAHTNSLSQCQYGHADVIKEVSDFPDSFACHVAPPLYGTAVVPAGHGRGSGVRSSPGESRKAGRTPLPQPGDGSYPSL